MENPMIHLLKGDGKGKTTAGYGLCLRALGNGFYVKVFPFLKTDKSCEIKALKNFKNAQVVCSPKNHNLYFTLSDLEKEEVKKEVNALFLEFKKTLYKKEADLILLDEILDCFYLKLIDEDDFLEAIKENSYSELILTGRNPSQKITDIADYISEISCEKHPYQKGISARAGIEY